MKKINKSQKHATPVIKKATLKTIDKINSKKLNKPILSVNKKSTEKSVINKKNIRISTIKKTTNKKQKISLKSKVIAEEAIRKMLIQKRGSIIQKSKIEIKKQILGEKDQLVESVMDNGDISVVETSEDINLKCLAFHKELLKEIDMSLTKLNEGTYGVCEECNYEISDERLKIMPFAVLCRDCQEKKEIIDKIITEDDI